jgi:hypothetical protein
MLKRHEVEILLKAGHAKTEVARLSGVSLRSVKRIAEERPVGIGGHNGRALCQSLAPSGRNYSPKSVTTFTVRGLVVCELDADYRRMTG